MLTLSVVLHYISTVLFYVSDQACIVSIAGVDGSEVPNKRPVKYHRVDDRDDALPSGLLWFTICSAECQLSCCYIKLSRMCTLLLSVVNVNACDCV